MWLRNSLLFICCFCVGLQGSASEAPAVVEGEMKPVLSKHALNSSIKAVAQSIQIQNTTA